VVDAIIDGDLIKPGGEGVFFVEGGEGVESFHKGFLDQVFSLFAVSYHLVEEIIDSAAIVFQELFISRFVARDGALD
jgi:hypothetical protein